MKLVALVVGVTAVVLGSTATTAPAAEAQGHIIDFAIQPPSLSVTAGDTITWTNGGNRPHTVTDRGGLFDTGAILPGSQATVTFDVPGTYEVFCEINPARMNAEVVVAPGEDPPTEVRIQAVDEARDGETKGFDPDELEVAAGTRLILANVGGLRHSLVADDGSFRTEIVQPGAEEGRFAGGNASVVVDEPGTYPFFCEIHPAAMRGVLTVTRSQVEAADRAPPERKPPPPRAVVSVVDFAFDQPETVVAPGGEIIWRNDGDNPHTATFDDVAIDTGRIVPADRAVLKAPAQPGSYSYFCSLHPARMRGVLVVSPEQSVAAEDPQAAPSNPAGGQSEETDGTLFAYAMATLVLGVGAVGLGLGLRRG